jgi:hypothetical protein
MLMGVRDDYAHETLIETRVNMPCIPRILGSLDLDFGRFQGEGWEWWSPRVFGGSGHLLLWKVGVCALTMNIVIF